MMFTIANTSGNLYSAPLGQHKLTRTVSGVETELVVGTAISQRDNVSATKYQDGMSSISYWDQPAVDTLVTYKLYAARNANTNSGSVSQCNMVLMEAG